jgi:hypothetical protein
MLDQATIDRLTPKWRRVEIDGLGAIEVKAPSERDLALASNLERNEWWVNSCVRSLDGSPLFPKTLDLNTIHGGLMSALKVAVFEPIPTAAPTGAGLQDCSSGPY